MKEKHSVLASFRVFLAAVMSFNVNALVVKILGSLIARGRSNGKANQLGLEATLKCYQAIQEIRGKANSGDRLAFAEMLFLATVLSNAVADVAESQPEMVKAFACASVTWPILLHPVQERKGNDPSVRIRAMGFGEAFATVKFPTNFGLGYLAFLLQCFVLLRYAASGDLAGMESRPHAESEWKKTACPELTRSCAPLSELPLEEVQNLKTTRERARVCGAVRFRVKGWYLKFWKLAKSWIDLAQPRKD